MSLILLSWQRRSWLWRRNESRDVQGQWTVTAAHQTRVNSALTHSTRRLSITLKFSSVTGRVLSGSGLWNQVSEVGHCRGQLDDRWGSALWLVTCSVCVCYLLYRCATLFPHLFRQPQSKNARLQRVHARVAPSWWSVVFLQQTSL